ncbi:unnamed protein product, partial [Wuchereria bancrofti]
MHEKKNLFKRCECGIQRIKNTNEIWGKKHTRLSVHVQLKNWCNITVSELNRRSKGRRGYQIVNYIKEFNYTSIKEITCSLCCNSLRTGTMVKFCGYKEKHVLAFAFFVANYRKTAVILYGW